jgi:hypothetical protein
MEMIQAATQNEHYRQWQRYMFRPPFQGSGLQDIATNDNPWLQLAPWGVEPGGKWKLVTACPGNLEPGDTAAVLHVVSIDQQKCERLMLWHQATGPMEIHMQSLASNQASAPIARIDLPDKVKTLPYRTFAPLPLYLWRWLRFAAAYSSGHIPVHSTYEHTFTLPDNFTPKQFELHVKEAVKCNIYGIGKVLDN